MGFFGFTSTLVKLLEPSLKLFSVELYIYCAKYLHIIKFVLLLNDKSVVKHENKTL